MTGKYKVLLDDVFFGEADTGIARLWRSLLNCFENDPTILAEKGIELWILNRTDKLNKFDLPRLDFPEYDHAHPAADRKLLSQVLQHYDFDLFISTYLTYPIGKPSLMIVYDLIPEVFKFANNSRGWLERRMQIIHASKFLCISENTKNDLLKFYNTVLESEVVVELPGIDHELFSRSSTSDQETFKARHNLTKFIAFVGNRYGEGGYKNADLLFRSLEKKSFKNLSIFFVGGEPLTNREISILTKANVNYVHEKLNDVEWVNCLSAADFLLYPSLYEGFGLPPLEALSVGTPVVLCDTSSLRESVGELGLFIDFSVTEDLIQILESGISRDYQIRIQKEGPIWAQNFQWRKMALALADLIKDQASHEQSAFKKELDDKISSYTEKVLYFQN